MEKKPTSAITVIFYIAGIIFLAVSAFMLYTAISYTRTYLQTYDAAFADMWSNSVQYIIAQFAPYLGIGVVCLGIGKAIKEAKIAAAAKAEPAPVVSESLTAADGTAEELKRLAGEMEAAREVLGIKIEEKEKRDTYRLNEMGKRLESFMAAVAVQAEADAKAGGAADVQTEEPEVLPDEPETADEAAAPEGEVPQIFTVADTMAMPEVPHLIKVPSIMRMSDIMAMPEITRVSEWLGDFDAYAKRDARKDTFSKLELEEAIAREEALQELKKEEQ